MSALQRSDIGEVWIQPDLFLVPDLPVEDRKSKAISSRNCLSCINFYTKGDLAYCKEGLKGYDYDLGCKHFTAYQIHCINLKIGDEIIFPQFNSNEYKSGIVKIINQDHIILETGQLLNHGIWQLPSSKPPNHCTNCNSFASSIPDASPWKFCLLKGTYTLAKDLKTCDDFKPIIPYKAPAKTRRHRGEGSGNIVKRFLSKKTKKAVKSYPQYWYDYELWDSGVCLRKGSAYIPKNKLEEIELMNNDKKPVKVILERLGKIV